MSKKTILYYIGNIPVREINTVRLSITENQYKKIAEIADKTGLAISMIIAMQGKPCCKCGNEEITITVPKNILSTKKLNNGRSKTIRLQNGEQNKSL